MSGKTLGERSQRGYYSIFGYFLLFMAVIFSIYFIYLTRCYLDLQRHAAITTATCARLEHGLGSDSGPNHTSTIYYLLVLHYIVKQDGIPARYELRYEVSEYQYNRARIGDRYPIVYSRRNPENAQVGATPKFPYQWLIGVLCMAIFGVLLIWWPHVHLFSYDSPSR